MPSGPGQIIGKTISSTTDGPFIADVNERNELLTTPTRFEVAVALGLVDGIEYRAVFGNSSVGIGSANEQVLGDGMTTRYQFPSTAAQMTIVSDSVNDTLTGTGAQIVFVRGNLADNAELFEAVLMDGTTPVTTTAEYLRVNSMIVFQGGDSTFNEGTITIKNGSDLLGQMEPTNSVTQTAIYSVPTGKVAVVYNFQIITGKDDNATALIRLSIPEFTNVSGSPLAQKSYLNSVQLNDVAFRFSAGADLEFTAFSEGVGNSDVSALFQMYIVTE